MGEHMLVKKDNYTKFTEFFGAMQILNDCLQLYKQEKPYHILLIAGQLRAILLDTTRGKPLFFQLAELIGMDLSIWYTPHDDEAIVPGFVLNAQTTNPSRKSLHEKQVKITLKKWLEQNILTVDMGENNRVKKSISDIIKTYANKLGGAHYDPDVDAYFYRMSNFKGILESTLLEVAEITLTMGVEIIKHVADFDYTISLAINPNQTISDTGCILEYYLDSSPMGIKLLIDKSRRLHFLMVNSYGQEVVINTDVIDWCKFHSINIDYEITSNFQTSISITIDGKDKYPLFLPFAFIVITSPTLYRQSLNKSFTLSCDGLEFGVHRVLQHRRVMSQIEKYHNLSYVNSDIKENSQLMTFQKETYASCEPGEKHLHFNIVQQSKTLSQIINGVCNHEE